MRRGRQKCQLKFINSLSRQKKERQENGVQINEGVLTNIRHISSFIVHFVPCSSFSIYHKRTRVCLKTVQCLHLTDVERLIQFSCGCSGGDGVESSNKFRHY